MGALREVHTRQARTPHGLPHVTLAAAEAPDDDGPAAERVLRRRAVVGSGSGVA